MRLRIAILNGCVTCQSARLAADAVPEDQATGVWAEDFAANPAYSPAERAAIEFAERMAVDHHSIDDAEIAALHEHFDDAEILELMMMAGPVHRLWPVPGDPPARDGRLPAATSLNQRRRAPRAPPTETMLRCRLPLRS